MPMKGSDRVAQEFDAAFADFVRRARPGPFEPNADVYLAEGGEAVVVVVEVAGADPSQLSVAVERRRLHISGRRVATVGAYGGDMLLKEIDYGAFAKRIHLPVAVVDDEATASYRDGFLTIRLPTSARQPAPDHRIEIRMTVKRTPA